MANLTIACALAILTYSVAAADGTISIHMAGEESISGVKAVIRDGLAFISIDDISERLDIVSKKLSDEVMGLCKDELCIVAYLDNEADAVHDSGLLFINANLIAQTLSSKVEWLVLGKTLRFVPVDQVMLDAAVETGDVVPNFALPSLVDGKMVPFSSFRGKRVLLFLWASW